MAIQSLEEAQAVARLLSEGKITGAGRASALADLRAFDSQQAAPQQAPQSPAEVVPAEAPARPATEMIDGKLHLNGKPVTTKDKLLGLADIGATLASQTAGQITGGLAGLGGMMTTGTLEGASNAYEATRNSVSNIWTPKTEVGQQVFNELGELGEKAAPFLQWADDALYENVSQENPAVAGTIKSVLLGIPEVFGVKGTSMKGLAGMKLPQRASQEVEFTFKMGNTMADAKKKAEALGIKLTNEDLRESVVQAADRISNARNRGADMDKTQELVQDAEKLAKEGVDNAFSLARMKKAFTSVKPFQAIVPDAMKHYASIEGFDLPKMPDLLARIRDLEQLDKRLPSLPNPEARPPVLEGKPHLPATTVRRGPLGEEIHTPTANVSDASPVRKETSYSKVRLNEIEVLRRRITNDIKGDGSKLRPYTAQDRALMDLRTRIDRALNDEFDKAAITGDPEAMEAWKNAKALHREYVQNFRANRTVAKFVANDANAEDLYRWAVGASAMNAKQQAAQVVTQLGKIGGAEAVEPIRAAILRDVLKPMFGDAPNFPAVVRNIDNLLEQNPALAKAAGINVDELQTLKKAAHAARFVTPMSPKWDKTFFTRIMARLVFGHGIAKAGARMNVAHRIIDSVAGTGVMKEKDILRYFAELDLKRPLIQAKNPKYKEILAYGILSDVSDMDEEESIATR